MMPITMIIGGLFYQFFGRLAPMMPYLIFTMLFITFSGLSLRHIRLSKMHLWLVLIQIVGSVSLYLVLSPFNAVVAQGLMMCVLTPTASSAPVLTGMLGGSVASVSAYSIVCNMSVAITAPILFSHIGQHSDLAFWQSFFVILERMIVLMVLPFVVAQIIRHFLPKISRTIVSNAILSFYLWIFALAIAAGRTLDFVMAQSAENHNVEIVIAAGALLICVSQFLMGRKIGRKYDDTVAGGQGLGQKNTILGIWMCQTYLNPIAAIGPGAYILWQNIVNSYQVWRNRKNL